MNNFETIEQCESTCDILIKMSQQGVGRSKALHLFSPWMNFWLKIFIKFQAAEEEAKVEMQKKGYIFSILILRKNDVFYKVRS